MKTSKVGLTLLLVCCVWAVFIVAGCTKDEVDTTGTIYGIVMMPITVNRFRVSISF